MCWPGLDGGVVVEQRRQKHPRQPKQKRMFFVNDRRASRASDEWDLVPSPAQWVSRQEMMHRQQEHQQQQLRHQQHQIDQQRHFLHQQAQAEHHRRLQEHQQQQWQHAPMRQEPRIVEGIPHSHRQIAPPPPPAHHRPDPRIMGWPGQHHGGGHDDEIVGIEEVHPDGQVHYVDARPRERSRHRNGHGNSQRRERSIFSESTNNSRSTGSRRARRRDRSPRYVPTWDSFEDLRRLGSGRRR